MSKKPSIRNKAIGLIAVNKVEVMECPRQGQHASCAPPQDAPKPVQEGVPVQTLREKANMLSAFALGSTGMAVATPVLALKWFFLAATLALLGAALFINPGKKK